MKKKYSDLLVVVVENGFELIPDCQHRAVSKEEVSVIQGHDFQALAKELERRLKIPVED